MTDMDDPWDCEVRLIVWWHQKYTEPFIHKTFGLDPCDQGAVISYFVLYFSSFMFFLGYYFRKRLFATLRHLLAAAPIAAHSMVTHAVLGSVHILHYAILSIWWATFVVLAIILGVLRFISEIFPNEQIVNRNISSIATSSVETTRSLDATGLPGDHHSRENSDDEPHGADYYLMMAQTKNSRAQALRTIRTFIQKAAQTEPPAPTASFKGRRLLRQENATAKIKIRALQQELESVGNEKETQVNEANARWAAAETAASALRKDAIDNHDRMAALEAEVAAAKQTTTEKEQVERAEKEALMDQVAELKRQVALADAFKADSTKKMETLEKDLEQVQTSLKSVNASSADNDEERAEAAKSAFRQTQESQASLSQATKENGVLQTECHRLVQENAALRAEGSKRSQENEALRADNAKVNQENAALRADALRAEDSQSGRENEALRIENAKLKSEGKSVSDNYSNALQHIQRLENQIRERNVTINNMTQQIQISPDDVEKVQALMAQGHAQINSLQGQLGTANQTINQIAGERDHYRHDLEDLRMRFDASDVVKLFKKVKSLRELLDATQTKVRDSERLLNDMREIGKKAVQEAVREERARLLANNQLPVSQTPQGPGVNVPNQSTPSSVKSTQSALFAQGRDTPMKHALAATKRQMEDLTGQIRELKAKDEDLQRQVQQLTSKNGRLEKQLHTAETALNYVNGVRVGLQKKVEDLEEDVALYSTAQEVDVEQAEEKAKNAEAELAKSKKSENLAKEAAKKAKKDQDELSSRVQTLNIDNEGLKFALRTEQDVNQGREKSLKELQAAQQKQIESSTARARNNEIKRQANTDQLSQDYKAKRLRNDDGDDDASADELFKQRFPNGWDAIWTSGAGLLCGLRAIILSLKDQHPELDRFPTVDELQRVVRSQEYNELMEPSLMLNRNNFGADQLATILRMFYSSQNFLYNIVLGFKPLDRQPRIVRTPESDRGDWLVVWIHNDRAREMAEEAGINVDKEGEEIYNHWEGIRPRRKRRADQSDAPIHREVDLVTLDTGATRPKGTTGQKHMTAGTPRLSLKGHHDRSGNHNHKRKQDQDQDQDQDQNQGQGRTQGQTRT